MGLQSSLVPTHLSGTGGRSSGGLSLAQAVCKGSVAETESQIERGEEGLPAADLGDPAGPDGDAYLPRETGGDATRSR